MVRLRPPCHSSVQPENLLINLDDDQIKLGDFGDAIRLSNMKYVHRSMGNLEFAAPELIDGTTSVHYKTDMWYGNTSRGDVYIDVLPFLRLGRSVGVILYTLLSGLSPFLDETDEQTSSNIVNVDFNFPESLFPRAFQPAKDLIQVIFVREPRFERARVLTLTLIFSPSCLQQSPIGE